MRKHKFIKTIINKITFQILILIYKERNLLKLSSN